MSSKERLVYLIILLLGSIYIYFLTFSESEDYVNDYNSKIDLLQQKVDSLHSLNDTLTIKIDNLNGQITQLDQELDLKDNKINNLKNEIKIKVDAVDSFSDDELEKFFTERYKQILDSITKTNSTFSN
jgi:peptidoglycan hydrolase CwlO-like protein